MFRIWFNVKTGKFNVQFLHWGLVWRTVRQQIDPSNTPSVREWRTYRDARLWVDEIGLGTAFLEQDSKEGKIFYGQAAR